MDRVFCLVPHPVFYLDEGCEGLFHGSGAERAAIEEHHGRDDRDCGMREHLHTDGKEGGMICTKMILVIIMKRP